MAVVVYRSTQYLSDADLHAMVRYLQDLPPDASTARPQPTGSAALFTNGEKLYARHCADCHGEQGEGAQGAYTPLAGNRAISLATPANLVQAVLHGGFPPATSGNPRPYGMPPWRQTLDDAEIAAVLSYIRQAWGHGAPPVSALDVMQHQ
jgi:mono/diheme cytochrome c family protein